jgi:hypothetical protein
VRDVRSLWIGVNETKESTLFGIKMICGRDSIST